MDFFPVQTPAVDDPGRAGVRGESFIHPSHVCQIGGSDQDPIGSQLHAPKIAHRIPMLRGVQWVRFTCRSKSTVGRTSRHSGQRTVASSSLAACHWRNFRRSCIFRALREASSSARACRCFWRRCSFARISPACGSLLPSAMRRVPSLRSRRCGRPVAFFSAPPPGRLVQPLERSKRFAFFDMGKGWGLNASDIVGTVAFLTEVRSAAHPAHAPGATRRVNRDSAPRRAWRWNVQ